MISLRRDLADDARDFFEIGERLRGPLSGEADRSGGVEVAVAMVAEREVLEHLRGLGTVLGPLHQPAGNEAGEGHRLALAAQAEGSGEDGRAPRASAGAP